MRIAVIDAQGAGLSQSIIKKLRKEINESITITALGTNHTATSNMIKAGAEYGYTGENEICAFLQSNDIDCIIGPIGVICSGGIQGEITPAISQAIFELKCTKYILPLQRHGLYIPGTRQLQIKDMSQEIVTHIHQTLTKNSR